MISEGLEVNEIRITWEVKFVDDSLLYNTLKIVMKTS